ncbi:MAG: hypothetical protein ACP5TL_01145 [Candidatus Micrarchaeia archaeon]
MDSPKTKGTGIQAPVQSGTLDEVNLQFEKKGNANKYILIIIIIVIAAIAVFYSLKSHIAPVKTITVTTIPSTTTIAIPPVQHAGSYLYIMSGANVSAINILNLSTKTFTLPYLPEYLHGILYSSSGYTYVPAYASYIEILKNGAYNGSILLSDINTSIVGSLYDPANNYTYFAGCNFDQNKEQGVVFIVYKNELVGEVPLYGCPNGAIAYSNASNAVYIGEYQNSTHVANIALIENKAKLAEIPVEGPPISMVYDSNNGYVYASTNYPSSKVIVINFATIVGSLNIALFPMLADPANGYVYGALNSGNTLFVLNGTKAVYKTNLNGSNIVNISYIPKTGTVSVIIGKNTTFGYLYRIKGIDILNFYSLENFSPLMGTAYNAYNNNTYIEFAYENHTVLYAIGNGKIAEISENTDVLPNFYTPLYDQLNGQLYLVLGKNVYVVNGITANTIATLGYNADYAVIGH